MLAPELQETLAVPDEDVLVPKLGKGDIGGTSDRSMAAV